MTLRPEYEQHLKAIAAAGAPAVWEVPVATSRSFSQDQLKVAADCAPIHSITDRYIPGPTADLHVRIFRPSTEENLPCIIYFHGSGWTLGFIDLFNPALSILAMEAQAVVIAVNYQKAPEHPYPIPLNDCHATVKWAASHASELGINPEKLIVGGDSAGGNLAAAVALKARDEGSVKIAAQLLVYPCTNMDFSTKSYIELAEGYSLTTRAMQWFWNQYIQNPEDAKSSYACPAVATTFKGLPPAVIITAQYDPLLSDGEIYRDLLKGDGVEVTYREFAGVIHGFFRSPEITPVSPEAIEYAAEELLKFIR